LDAVREGIINAVCHRDYADSGNVVVKIFDDRLEIWNPGSLPLDLTVDDLRKSHESKPRNKLIARAFFLIKYIEQFGTGTGRMISDCREAGVPEPEFESRAASFRAVFRRTITRAPFEGLGLSDAQIKALHKVEINERISRAEYEQIAGVSPAAAKRQIASLVKKRLLVKKGSGTVFWYEAPKENP
jgi:ATP-dependent DNA helicase RecG